uniref:basic proline-rich protein-like n=1 Tax=Oncorhynchus gorbuscha TaxID=8017 RepID=UPI001EAF6B79|nr:basic proline-rich protein-like [Oncorhynchus gorbuscha]
MIPVVQASFCLACPRSPSLVLQGARIPSVTPALLPLPGAAGRQSTFCHACARSPSLVLQGARLLSVTPASTPPPWCCRAPGFFLSRLLPLPLPGRQATFCHACPAPLPGAAGRQASSCHACFCSPSLVLQGARLPFVMPAPAPLPGAAGRQAHACSPPPPWSRLHLLLPSPVLQGARLPFCHACTRSPSLVLQGARLPFCHAYSLSPSLVLQGAKLPSVTPAPAPPPWCCRAPGYLLSHLSPLPLPGAAGCQASFCLACPRSRSPSLVLQGARLHFCHACTRSPSLVLQGARLPFCHAYSLSPSLVLQGAKLPSVTPAPAPPPWCCRAPSYLLSRLPPLPLPGAAGRQATFCHACSRSPSLVLQGTRLLSVTPAPAPPPWCCRVPGFLLSRLPPLPLPGAAGRQASFCHACSRSPSLVLQGARLLSVTPAPAPPPWCCRAPGYLLSRLRPLPLPGAAGHQASFCHACSRSPSLVLQGARLPSVSLAPAPPPWCCRAPGFFLSRLLPLPLPGAAGRQASFCHACPRSPSLVLQGARLLSVTPAPAPPPWCCRAPGFFLPRLLPLPLPGAAGRQASFCLACPRSPSLVLQGARLPSVTPAYRSPSLVLQGARLPSVSLAPAPPPWCCRAPGYLLSRLRPLPLPGAAGHQASFCHACPRSPSLVLQGARLLSVTPASAPPPWCCRAPGFFHSRLLPLPLPGAAGHQASFCHACPRSPSLVLQGARLPFCHSCSRSPSLVLQGARLPFCHACSLSPSPVLQGTRLPFVTPAPAPPPWCCRAPGFFLSRLRPLPLPGAAGRQASFIHACSRSSSLVLQGTRLPFVMPAPAPPPWPQPDRQVPMPQPARQALLPLPVRLSGSPGGTPGGAPREEGYCHACP